MPDGLLFIGGAGACTREDISGCQIPRAFADRGPGGLEPLVGPTGCAIDPLAIGQAYAWSVFKKPLETSLGISGVASALPFTLGICTYQVGAIHGRLLTAVPFGYGLYQLLIKLPALFSS
jgi:hypothetical protein